MSGDYKTDMDVIGAWKLGYTGKGVVVTILDDGIQRNHTDLVASYDPQASYDLNDNDSDPMPTFDELNRHGTRCAGEIAMAPNNSFCGVGIAYGASIGGVRMLDGKITDRVEAEALSFNYDHIDIYSASWGPNDDGKTVEGPGRLAQAAILKGIRLGRNGKGAIYVWASGNGGLKDDDCDCDGYTDSVYTFSVSSAAEDGTFPWYGEKCASTLTSTYSTGSNNKRMIMTTDIGNGCAQDHSGTSASAPMAAGIIALALEANPSLTWRDVQHIAVWTAEPEPLLKNNEGWVRNAAGLYVNSRFGFGLMNAFSFVMAARSWTNVPKQRICTTVFPSFTKRSISDTSGAIINFRTDACAGQINEVNYLEHVQLVLDIVYPIRGHLSIFVVSPQGTRTQLLKVRREDKSPAGFRHWPFMSVHTWAENPKGVWQLEVDDKSGRMEGINGIINNITLVVYGTTEQPAHYATSSRRDVRDDFVTNNRKDIDDLWLQRVKRLINDRALQRADYIDGAMRYLDAVNQIRKRSTLRSYTVSEFVSR
uniref:Neuroendocrine convertase 1 n=2 Tax=Ascaris suum TaxID=6253 RepID=F1L3M6_ASCSU